MELFNPNSNVDFMGLRRWTAAFSMLICFLSLFALGWKGLAWGLDFTGGIQVVVKYVDEIPNIDAIRHRLSESGFSDAQVMNYGTTKNVMISIGPHASTAQSVLVDKMMACLPGAQKERVDIVGPQVGKELATKGALAVLVSLIALLIYIALRFEFKLAVSAVVALIHDPVLILGVFAFWGRINIK